MSPIEQDTLEVPVPGGALRGWVSGNGRPIVLLHGGPGLDCDYMDVLAEEFDGLGRLVNFQQRGLTPSMETGEFTVAEAITDVVAVIDALGTEPAFLVGHSWGGHLALRVAAARPDRLAGLLVIDPLGVTGDGGNAHFNAELPARAPQAIRERLAAMDEEYGEDWPLDAALESVQLLWPYYFANPGSAAPFPGARLSLPAMMGLFTDVAEGAGAAATALTGSTLPARFLAGAASPMPWGQASLASAELFADAMLTLAPTGHFPWLERPGSVRPELEALLSSAGSGIAS